MGVPLLNLLIILFPAIGYPPTATKVYVSLAQENGGNVSGGAVVDFVRVEVLGHTKSVSRRFCQPMSDSTLGTRGGIQG